ncbi:hypothetical protein GCM10009430_17700 [Aquimarina litoralis]|uniref:Bacteriocin n=1 Tax=Aquimarina litoralis TaxID=584605 RepID=A0ABP3TZI9_9FLAO
MYKKLLSIQGINQLNKQEQSTINGGYQSSCPSNGSGATGQSCSVASQCRPILSGFPVACIRGCCLSAF